MSSSRKPPSLNKLTVQGPVWLASDIHLGADNPKTAHAFHGFLDQAGAHAGALFLLGDIFNVWIGDDWAKQAPAWLQDSLTKIAQTAAKIPVWLGHGNRDFLMGEPLAQQLGARLLAEQVLLDVDGQQVLLAHGDEFCSTDKAYQRFRRVVRNPWIQALYLSLGIKQRLAIANRARRSSQQAQSRPNAVYHDVSLDTVAHALKAAGTRTLIHGHTHRPGHFVDQVQHQSVDRWVLPDWEADHLSPSETARGGGLIIDANGIHTVGLQLPPTKR